MDTRPFSLKTQLDQQTPGQPNPTELRRMFAHQYRPRGRAGTYVDGEPVNAGLDLLGIGDMRQPA